MEVCKTVGLRKSYFNNSKEVNAIIDCNLEIGTGECIAICGSKESGKTTLLRILSGLERPTEGSVFINQKDITSFSDDELAIMRRNEIGYLFHDDSLIPELNVRENIIMPAILAHSRYDEDYFQDLIGHLKLKEFLSYKPKQLSQIQRQSVIYARALINNPTLILVDEPVYEGTLQMDKRILDYLLNLVYLYGKTLILVTKDTDFSIFVDQMIRLEHGEVVENRRIS